MALNKLISLWRSTPQIFENIIAWETIPARQPAFFPFPADMHPALVHSLKSQGFFQLFSHQLLSWQHIHAGKSIAVVTGTASGKTLCYNLPVIDHLLVDPSARALYIFPTKALAHDQKKSLEIIIQQIRAWPGYSGKDHSTDLAAGAYDGDTPQNHRSAIRKNARIVITNPDMLHTGILPYHTNWADFFTNLRFIVVDEMHIYRGVFGSHVANVFRRLKRIARFYGSNPQFILTSATIANPVELATRLVEEPVHIIDQDGSSRGEKHFLIYNPPIVDEELGLRRSLMQESVYLASDLLAYDVQTILFARSRRVVELTLTYLRNQAGSGNSPQVSSQFINSLSTNDISQPSQPHAQRIRAYRSGYLPHERRAIETGLRNGSIRAVVATNALELGIDIGGMDAVLLAGYPGSIAATWQQAGRAGRGLSASLSVLITSANPLDQFLARHPEYFFGRSPEQALINPDNLLILLEHIRCAAFELPFRAGENYGRVESTTVEALLAFLIQAGILHFSQDRYYWMAEGFPAQDISLRNASAQRILLQSNGQTIGEVDGESACWMVHPGAIYLHEGNTFLVDDLDLEKSTVQMHPVSTDYFTEPVRQEVVTHRQTLAEESNENFSRFFGEVLVTSQVTGFRRVLWESRQRVLQEALDLPPSHLETTGCWLVPSERTIETLRQEGLWNNDPNRYGPNWSKARDAARARDGYTCQSCGAPESGRAHDVHHKIPFRTFENWEQANRLENLVTLCHSCHRRAEAFVRVRTGLAGLAFVLGNLAPLFLMCDQSDLGVLGDSQAQLAEGKPAVIFFDRIPAGIGLSERLFEILENLLAHALDQVSNCPCRDGCPSCVGPGGEQGAGSKAETLALLHQLVK